MMGGQTIEGSASRATVGTVEAGRIIGVKPDSIRARLRRGSLQGYQDEAGEWFIYADQLAEGRARPGPRRAGRVVPDATGDKMAQRVAVLETQLEAVISERDHLRQLTAVQAEAVNAAAGRLSELAERIAQLQLPPPPDAAPQDQPQGHQRAPQVVQAAGDTLTSTVLGEELRALRVDLARQRRPWWRRIVGS